MVKEKIVYDIFYVIAELLRINIYSWAKLRKRQSHLVRISTSGYGKLSLEHK